MRDLDRGRRYGTIEDFRNFVKLAYASPYLHHSGGTVCEPVDVPVNKRHLDMVYSHIRYSDKPFMGSVTAPERARDTVEMARITFGADYLEDHPVILSLINANSPLVWDSTMLGAARAYAEANQATLLTPFILAGAMAPVTAAGVCAQTLAEALGGMTFVQLVRPGRAGRPRSRSPARCRCSRGRRRSGRRSRRSCCTSWPRSPAGSASRSGPAARCAPRRSPTRRPPTSPRRRSSRRSSPGVNFVLHAAGWLEGGLAVGYEKFVLDADQCGMMAVFVDGVDMSENGQALDAILANPPGQHYLGSAHTLANFESAFYRSRRRRQQQLRAVAGGRLARRRPAGQRDLEADAGRVRGAAARPGDRRGAARLHRPAQGVDARLGGLAVVLFRRRRRRCAGPGGRPGAACSRAPTFELIPLKNALDQAARLPPGATVS